MWNETNRKEESAEGSRTNACQDDLYSLVVLSHRLADVSDRFNHLHSPFIEARQESLELQAEVLDLVLSREKDEDIAGRR